MPGVSMRVIRRRIRSVQNTAKITRAMEMIAAAKMRRAQQNVLATRPYAHKMQEVLAHLAAARGKAEGEAAHPLLQRREVKSVTVVHITPDRGLTGGLNANVNRTTAAFLLAQKVPTSVVTVGRKGRDFMVRYGRNVRAVFMNLGDYPKVADISPVGKLVTEEYSSQQTDAVYLAYAEFVNTAVQRPVVRQLLPIESPRAGEGELRTAAFDFIYEPSPGVIFDQLLPRFVEMQLYHAVLESAASEQSARMVAMRNATENAKEMTEDLTLTLNKARQESITTELLDITGGVVALER